jgi:2-amino-4-hydroxy-6-hydroxymethyldihydropteridine diphosphokinase
MGTLALIGLGSNVGDRKAHLERAVAALAETPGVVLRAVSSYHETTPAGGPAGQGAFLNAAAAVETTLAPRQLLDFCHAIEADSGRVREVRWGERTLDVDLLLFGDETIDEPGLVVPHPRMAVRRFVLAPMTEVAPEAVDPLTRRTVADLLANLDRRPSFVVLLAMPTPVFRRVSEGLAAVGLFEETGSDESYEARTDLLAEPDFFAILDEKAREYEASRWSADIWGDRWVVSDFWFDRLVRDASHRLDGEERDRWRERFAERKSCVIRPTFLVAPPYSLSQIRLWSELNPDDPLGGRDVPVLCPGFDDPAGFLRDRSIDEIFSELERPERIDAIVRETLAACGATRG